MDNPGGANSDMTGSPSKRGLTCGRKVEGKSAWVPARLWRRDLAAVEGDEFGICVGEGDVRCFVWSSWVD